MEENMYEFRGKSDDDWVYGMLLRINPDDCGEHGEFKNNKYMIQTDELETGEYRKYFITDDDSIGQYTGIKDMKGRKIYENDIVKKETFDYEAPNHRKVSYAKVKYIEACSGYQLVNRDNKVLWDLASDRFYIEICGNMTDTPELMEV